MQFDLSCLLLMLECFTKGGPMILSAVYPAYEYKNRERTDKVVGLKVTVVLVGNDYNKLTVTVSDPIDTLSAVLKKAKDPVYVNFDGFAAKIYKMDGKMGVSVKADSVYVVNDNSTTDINFDSDFDVPELKT